MSRPKDYIDRALVAYHDGYVKVADDEMRANTVIAVQFMEKFRGFVGRKFGVALNFAPQGSAFEGLKVHHADEFDFQLVIMQYPSSDPRFLKKSNDRHPIIQDIQRMKKGIHVLRCYHPILMNKEDVERTPAFKPMRKIWPFLKERYGCVSAREALEELHEALDEFEGEVNAGRIRIQDVRRVEAPIRGNPAVNPVLHKTDGSKISIDLSPVIRSIDRPESRSAGRQRGGVYMEVDRPASRGMRGSPFSSPQRSSTVSTCTFSANPGDQYFVAKRKPALRDIHDPRLELLWLEAHARQEKQLIDAKQEYERRNYRILKSIFRKSVSNSHIWKTIFMSQDEPFPRSPLKFIEVFVSRFVSCLRAERVDRRENEIGAFPQAQKYNGDKLLITRFNNCENVLRRAENSKIKEWYDHFKHLDDLLQAGNHSVFLQKAFGARNFSNYF